MMLVGITGIVGSGKTTVSSMLRKKGLKTINLDKIVKRLIEREDVKKEIENEFGRSCIAEGRINIKRLSRLVFQDGGALKRLENIIHPRVKAETNKKIKSLEEKGVKTVVIDAPLLFETDMYKECGKTVVVSASAGTTKERLRGRGMQEDDIDRRTAIQLPLTEKEARADHVIHNDGTKKDLENEVHNLLNSIKRWEVETNAS